MAALTLSQFFHFCLFSDKTRQWEPVSVKPSLIISKGRYTGMSNYEKLLRALMAFTAEQLNQFLESEEAKSILLPLTDDQHPREEVVESDR